MRLLIRFPILCFAMVLLSIVGICVAMESVGFLLFAGTAAAMSWYLTEGPRGRHLPRWVSNLLIILASLYVFIELVQSGEAMNILGRFIVWLTLIKLYERKAPRDYAQLLILSLSLMVVGSLLSMNLLFGLILLGYSLLGIYVLVLFQLYRDFEQAKESRRDVVPENASLVPRVKPIIGPRLGLHFRSVIGSIALAGFFVSIIIFLSVPRGIGGGFASAWAERIAQSAGRIETGVSDSVDLAATSSTDVHRVVMTVRVLDRNGRAVRLPDPLLLRGHVLDVVEPSGRWISSTGRPHDRIETSGDRMIPINRAVDTDAVDDAYTFEFTLATAKNRLFTPWAPLAVSTERSERFRLDPWALTLTAATSRSLRSKSYRVQTVLDPPSELLQEIQQGQFTRWRREGRFPIDEEIRQLAISLLREAGIPTTPPDLEPADGQQPSRRAQAEHRLQWNRDVASVFEAYLKSDRFHYASDLRDVLMSADQSDAASAVRQFLFESRRGDCNFFAAALAALCHNMGAQARLVTGYLGYEFDEERQHYLIRQSNAHAWVEVRSGIFEWATFDPTPAVTPGHLASIESATLADRLRWLYDRLEFSWQSDVLAFDRSAQESIGASLQGRMAGALSEILIWTRTWARYFNQALSFAPAAYIYLAAIMILAVLWLYFIVWAIRRIQFLRGALALPDILSRRSRRMLRQLSFYLDALQALDRAGCPKPSWTPPLQFSHELARHNPTAAETLREISDLFYQGRYGLKELQPQEIENGRTLVQRLREQLHRN